MLSVSLRYVSSSCNEIYHSYLPIRLSCERAFVAFGHGTFVQPSQFSHECSWQAMKTFFGHVDRLSERRWGLILDVKSDVEESDEDVGVDQSMISAYRADLYIPSSPLKA